MSKLISKKAEELAVSQKKKEINLAIQKVGQLCDRDFFDKTKEFTKICNLPDQELSLGVSIIFTRIAVFTGLKQDIDPFIKQDIVNGLITNHRGLSLEEIEYAFCLDRDGVHGEPTPHYQFLNREYVGRVLNKYNKWKDQKREQYRIPTKF
jgi:hypothetical protein